MEYRLIGKIIKPFGLKGDVKIETYTDFIDDRFKNGSSVYLDINGFKKEFTVLRHRMHKNQLLVTFKDFEDIKIDKPLTFTPSKYYELIENKA